MKGIRKTTFREIKSSFGRFLAIFAIIALGVGFFAGLKVAKEAMVASVTDYLDRHGFYDFRLISTLGFDQENVDTFAAARDVEAAEGSVSFDVLYRLEDGSQGVIKAYSVTDSLNTLKLVSGRMPEQSGECVADSANFGKSAIGSKIYLSEDNKEEDLEHFAHREYTVVGLVQSPLYLQYERGNTSLGTGRLNGFIYLDASGFDTDYFTEVYVRFEQDCGLYSEEYDGFISEKSEIWENLTQEAALARYTGILEAAREEIADARAQLEEKQAEGEEELADAAGELEDAAKQLADGEQALADAREELAEGERTIREKQKEIQEGWAEIAQKETELAQGEVTIAGQEPQRIEARAAIEKNELALIGGERELAEGKAQLKSGEAVAAVGRRAIDESRRLLNAQLEDLSQGEGELNEAAINRVKEALQRLDSAEEELRAQEQELAAARQQIEASEQQLNSGWQAVTAARQQLTDGQLALSSAKLEISSGRLALEEGRRALTEGESEIASASQELAAGRQTIADKEAELAEGRQEYEDGVNAYEEARQEFEEQIAGARRQIEDAEEELAELTEPDTYVLDRDTNIGYVCFENDSTIVEGIANIFPVFFFLVAALVCITTMNRMVEEQRTQIGVLKALGYGEGTIMSKYLMYSGLAALTGCVSGFFLGTWAFPKVIWFCYGIMYDADPIYYVFNWKLAAISLAGSLLCSIGTTWLSCRMELAQVAAALMRPKAPKAGKRVLLEYVPFIWKRLGFLKKVSFRNIFRYKKRLFMMVVGISGCTALLVTGFGIKDSISDIAARQFGEIQTYDIGVTLKEGADDRLRESLDEMGAFGIEEYICVMEKNMDLVTDLGVRSVYLVAGTAQEMPAFMDFHTERGEGIAYPALGEAVISHKLAEDYALQVGGTITLRDSERNTYQVTVSAIYENYIYDYVHISEDTWRELTGGEPERKTVYVNLAEEDGSDAVIAERLSAHELSAELMKMKQVSNVTVNADTMERLGNMLSSLDIIVVVVILCAAGLAFIVLYNLTNINITERVREIATIKVLGFYKRETAAYVFRENILLTLLGMAVGLGLGRLLHRLVMNEIRVDMIAFDIYVKPVSFIYSGLLTLLFAWLVNLAMRGKLEAISMTESLKSVD